MTQRLGAWMLSLIAGCAPRAVGPPVSPDPVETPLVFVHETEAMHGLAFEAMLDALAEQQVVLVGETHLDDNTHRLERAILEGLIRRKPGKVVLSLEMFQRDVQPVVDAYLRGEIDEQAFRREARPWPNYDTGYRPLVELARRSGVPVVAANLPADLQRAFAMKGAEAEAGLTPQQRAVFPRQVIGPRDDYWARLGQTLRDHFHGHDPDAPPEKRAYSVQNLWDNAMAESTLDALEEDPERTVVLMAGAFHVEYGQGVAHQIRSRRSETELALVTIVATHDLQTVDPEGDRERADYLLYTPARARGARGGVLATYFPTELEFRLDVPDALDAGPLPLLVWLGDTAQPIVDDAHYWTAALGGEAILVMVEPPHPLQAEDLRMAGRWWWPHRTERDLSHLSIGLARLLEYVGDRFAIDPERVVVAGRGHGATVAIWAGFGGDMPVHLVGWAPRDAEAVGLRALPGTRPSASRRAVLLGADEAVAGALAEVGYDVHAEPLPERLGRHALENRLRTGLGLPEQPWGAPTKTLAVRSEAGRRWAELHARNLERAGETIEVVVGDAAPDATRLEAKPADFADGQALPLAPGRFEGTTILVLPADLSESDRGAWQALEEQDVIKQRSRFASLRVTTADALPELLETLKADGKKSMLIVPATFAAAPEDMQSLHASVAPHADGLDMHWLPGLGAALARAAAR